jgi:hypothetical protein
MYFNISTALSPGMTNFLFEDFFELAKIFDIKNVLFAEKSSARRGDEENDWR